tara:strand:- start:163 stop:405 length:243 start_codon:yes stop_codon:yes gene_type:complete
MDHQNKIYDVNELVEGIMEFDSYLDDEYSVLHQIVHEHDFIRADSEKEQILQDELEERLQLIAFIKSRFRADIFSKINFS